MMVRHNIGLSLGAVAALSLATLGVLAVARSAPALASPPPSIASSPAEASDGGPTVPIAPQMAASDGGAAIVPVQGDN
jgi:hypothetical protein